MKLPQFTFDCPRTCPAFERRDLCRFSAVLAACGVRGKVTSHVVKCEVEFKSLAAIHAAAAALGLSVVEKSTYQWYGRHVGDYPVPPGFDKAELGKCDFALAVTGKPEAYEAGMICRDGAYHMLFDFWGVNGRALQDVIGDNGAKFAAEYAVQAARLAAESQGWLCERTDNGGLRVYHPGGGTLDVTPGGEIDANGFLGAGCHDAASVLANALGSRAEFQAKPEFHQQRQQLRGE